jgi:hypothetical protein
MAQTAEKLGAAQNPRFRDELVPMRGSRGPSVNRQERALQKTFANLASASRDVTTRARSRAAQLKKEHPLQLLTVIGGTAACAGDHRTNLEVTSLCIRKKLITVAA